MLSTETCDVSTVFPLWLKTTDVKLSGNRQAVTNDIAQKK
jgi:hypothetical protein